MKLNTQLLPVQRGRRRRAVQPVPKQLCSYQEERQLPAGHLSNALGTLESYSVDDLPWGDDPVQSVIGQENALNSPRW
jgi:streptogramin lyase